MEVAVGDIGCCADFVEGVCGVFAGFVDRVEVIWASGVYTNVGLSNY